MEGTARDEEPDVQTLTLPQLTNMNRGDILEKDTSNNTRINIKPMEDFELWRKIFEEKWNSIIATTKQAIKESETQSLEKLPGSATNT